MYSSEDTLYGKLDDDIHLAGNDSPVLNPLAAIGITAEQGHKHIGRPAASISARTKHAKAETMSGTYSPRLWRNSVYAPGSVDGLYGPKTSAAVTAFQSAAGIKADGIVGPQTRKALQK